MFDFDTSAFLGVFFNELDENLQLLDEELLNLEKNTDDKDAIQTIFRALHTIKGSSATLGFEKMEILAHRMENIFDYVREGKMRASVNLINTIFECLDYVKVLKEAIGKGTLEECNIDPFIEKLESISTNDDENISFPKKKRKNVEASHEFPIVVIDENQKQSILNTFELSLSVIAIYIKLENNAKMKAVRAFLIQNNLREVGDLIASFPSKEEIEDKENFKGNLVYIIATEHSKQEIFHLINEIPDIQSVSTTAITEDNLEQYCEGKKFGFIETNEKDIIKVESELSTMTKVSDNKSKVNVNQTIRVDVDKLERLMNLVGELVIDQTRLEEVKNRITNGKPTDLDLDMLNEVSNHFGRVISDLQEGMMKTRMFPIEQLFSRFPRMVRDTAQKANKEINFIMEGKETELDRTLIEEIGDPLIHLLRNAIDHGIEPPEERERLGKTREGNLLLKAEHQDNHIVISIKDDGRGIDAQKIKTSAIKKGIITEEDANEMLEKDLVFLIFKPGFSTAQQVTEISGRGVGMDIVRAHIEKLNGLIDIETVVGKGTTFTIKLPLTLAIIRSLLVELGEKKFAIPLVNVLEIIRLRKDEIKTIKNQEIGVLRGKVLPLVRMHSRLGVQEQESNSKRLFVVVVGLADKRIGLIVEKTLGNREIVIKSLGRYIGNPSYIAGSTIMGDGNVALILDVASIIKNEGVKDHSIENEKEKMKKHSNESQYVTFKLGSEEYGLEINRVKDIIRVPSITNFGKISSEILGMINLRGNLIPVVDFRQKFNVPQKELTRKSRVVVVEIYEKEIGILVDEVMEVLKIDDSFIDAPPDDSHHSKSNGIKGVCNLNNRLIIIINFLKIFNLEEFNQIPIEEYKEMLEEK